MPKPSAQLLSARNNSAHRSHEKSGHPDPLAVANATTVGRPTTSDDAPRDHLVQFYERDEFLVETLVQFTLDAFREEACVILIATASHRHALRAQLQARGIDLAAMERTDRFHALDAAAALERLMVGRSLDRERFQAHVGQLVRRAAEGGRRVRAFGEMVALLWEAGNQPAALQLEGLWNDLRRECAFTLLCAYPLKAFAHHSAGNGFEQVCGCHARVLPAEGYVASGRDPDERFRTIALLQQRTAALEAEIAEHKRTQAALRRREAELSSFVENARIGLHWVDARGIILWANPAEIALLGYARDDYIGHHISEFHADATVSADILARLARGETLRDHEARLRCKDGEIKIVLIDSSVYWEDGQFAHTQCFMRDVTAERRADASSRLLAAIVESSDDAIISKNLDGVVMSWNQAAERTFGYAAAEAIGQPITLLIPPDRLDEEPQILARIRRGERIDHFETVRRRKDGTLLNISVTISPVKDRHGHVIGASKVARDITGQKRAEEALRAARDQLARANEQLEQRVQERTASLREAVAQMEEFSYTVSHDLRAPLRGMQVYSQALLEDYDAKLDAEGRHCLTRIAENAVRLDKMVLDVLTFSRMSRSELKMVPVALDRLVRDLVQHYPGMQPPRAFIQIDPLADVLGHEPSLTQALSNLLSNAVKFVAPGVTPQIRLWTERTGNRVRLCVQDNGIGIKPDLQNRLFRMFERVHVNLPYEGTGVGLAIARKAVTRMGGEIGVVSDGLRGARFWITLPAAEANA